MSAAPPSPTHVRAVSLWGQVLCGTLTSLGLLGLLRGGRTGFREEAQTVLVFDLHPVASLVHLALGLAGIMLITRYDTARAFLAATGALLVAWGLLTLMAGGSPRELLADDGTLAALYLASGVVSLALVRAPGRRGRAENPAPPSAPAG